MDPIDLELLLKEKFQTEGFEEFYLVEFEYKTPNQLSVYIDTDQGVNSRQCARVSRFLEEHLDEANWNEGKYILEVSSPGVDRPLKFPRQYLKNIGRTLEVKLTDGEKIKGKLVESNEDFIVLEYRDKIKEGKKKKNIVKQTEIPHDTIAKAMVKISFN